LQIEFEGLNSKGDEQLRCIDSVFGEAKDRWLEGNKRGIEDLQDYILRFLLETE
jgi:hypothetical protein